MNKKKKGGKTMIKTEEEFDKEIDIDMEPGANITEKEILQSKWIIDADLAKTQLKEAYRMLEKGIKLRKVALYLGIHRSKIKPVK